MRIISKDNIDFVLPAGFAAELTKYNVLLSTAGEQTQPITLPPDPVNMKLIGYSNRLDAYYKPLTDLEVLVSDGLFHRWCNMGIHSADDEDGISCTLYFASGQFYSLMAGKKLASLAWPTIKSPTYAADSLTQRVQYLIDLLKSEYQTPTTNALFNVTAVLSSQEYTYKKTRVTSTVEETVSTPVLDIYGNPTYDGEGNQIFNTETLIVPIRTDILVTEKLILNGYESDSPEEVMPARPLPEHYTNFSLTKLAGESIQTTVKDNETITLPIGYGITAFVRVKYILSVIFTGYVVNTDAITTVFSMFDKEESVINNVADAIVAGVLKIGYLLPDCTVKEFISKCEERYAGKFIVNETNKTVTFISYDAVQSSPDIDITQYLCSKPKTGASDYSILTIKYKSDITTTTNESDEKSVDIEFDFLERKKVQITKVFTDSTGKYFTYVLLPFYVIDIGDIVHKFSTVLVANKTQTEDKKTSTDIQFITVDRYANSFFMRKFTISDPAFDTALHYASNSTAYAEPIHPLVKSFYEKWKLFLQNSNIPISAEMDFPTVVLESMNLQSPKLLQGQPVMIESIKQVLGSDSSQDVKFRTLRLFIDR
jgi:hypothetical protein